jgi:hypothetical protein
VINGDWTPVILATAGAITVLASAVAALLQAMANGRGIGRLETQTNSHLAGLTAQVVELHRVNAEQRVALEASRTRASARVPQVGSEPAH